MNESNDLMDSLLKEHAKMKQGTTHDVEFLEQLEERIDLDERGNVIPLATQRQVKPNQKRFYGIGLAGLGIAACVAFTFIGYKQWGPQHGNIVLSSDATTEQLKNGVVEPTESRPTRSVEPMVKRSAKNEGGNSFAMKSADDPPMMSADLAVTPTKEAKSKMMQSRSSKKAVGGNSIAFTSENKFVSSFHKETRLSRFAMNVKNASYPFIKQSILAGRPVAADLVKLEELVNAFDYDYPRPSGKHPLAITLDAVDCPWNLNHKLIRVAIQGKSTPDQSAEIALDAEVQVEFNPEKVKQYRLIGYDRAPHKIRNKSKQAIKNETIHSGHTVTALYEVVLGKAAEADGMNSLRYEKKVASKSGFTSVPVEFANELMFVKLAYKTPSSTIDSARNYISASLDTIQPWGKADADFKFSSATALLGMELRESKFKGMGSLAMVEKLAIEGKGEDKKGEREEFIKLVQKLKDRK